MRAVALSILFVCAGLLSYLADPADLVSTEAAAAAGPVPATQYYHSRNPYLGPVYAGRVTLNGSGKVISNIGPIKPLSPEEKAALADEVPDQMATADALIAKARAARSSRGNSL